MKPSTILKKRKRTELFCLIAGILVLGLFLLSLISGKYPLSIKLLIEGDEMQWRVFRTLRLSRTLVGLVGGFALGVSGFVYQTVFRNPLASPDIIGVSSGASAGAAAGILFLSGATAVTVSAFVGALLAVATALALSGIDRNGRSATIVLAGIAVHALAQTVLMYLKLTADPERELASIEYWIMGSLSGISSYSMSFNLVLCIACIAVLFLMHRQIILLSADEGEAKTLGVNVGVLRLIVLLTATLVVSSVVSLTGLIAFVGLLAPHGARLITKSNRMGTMWLSGLMGSVILLGADILARCVARTELPVSIFTSLLGAPFLIFLIVRGRKKI
ncbi:MAG: iron ABC transporter permease [Clostridia bacterium]|nr:iron ABC transporter permease [Clostridia bacterium]